MSLISVNQALWTKVQEMIAAARQADQPLEAVQTFITQKRSRAAHTPQPALYVLERTVRVLDWGANRGIAESAIVFGITNTTLRPEQVQGQLEELIYALTDVFLNDPAPVAGIDDVKIDEIDVDAQPFGPEDTQPWATARLVWEFQFIRD